MSSQQPDARRRVLAATTELLARHGLNATSIRLMAKHADAPLGSIYHHFPGGKQQMVIEALEQVRNAIDGQLNHYLRPDDAFGLQGFLSMWRDVLVRSDFRIGCPLAATVAEEPIEACVPDILAAAAQAFRQWENRLAFWLEKQGHADGAARELATLIIASLEGAIMLCRAQRHIAPFDRVVSQLSRMISHT